MKNIVLLLMILFAAHISTQAQTKVTKTISPINSDLPVVFQKNIKGGVHQIDDLKINAADASGEDIAADLKEMGMLVWDNASAAHYQWNGAWLKVNVIYDWTDAVTAKTGQIFLKEGMLFKALADVLIDANGLDDNDTDPAKDDTNWKSVGDGMGDHVATKTITAKDADIPVLDMKDVKGGYHVVADDAELTALTGNHRKIGMIIWHEANGNHFQYAANGWNRVFVLNLRNNGTVAHMHDLFLDYENSKIYRCITSHTITQAQIDSGVFDEVNWEIVGDGFGKHIAEKNITMGDKGISNDGPTDKLVTDAEAEGLFFDTDGNATFKQNVTIRGDLAIPSDGRLKNHVETIHGALNKIQQLRGVTFQYNNQKKYANGTQYGLIAQELQKQFPTMVKMGPDGYYKVNYLQLTAVLLQAINEQQQMINRLVEESK
ncbi:hypothetical protein DF185_09365 [Marinifilum breve]|uniref:Peptidase S74 domain-containing protein n=1 Tax=Marinifilum breve TaxID=2184082 RepID=A0A2V3ZZB3_9BACT|nr:tail fiber domain-containing protein [Marinifilum breve]PXY01666.1 hypothetical protein DF185_09365 [Marinifilum breve]